MASTKSAALGPKLTELERVLERAWLAGFTTKSDFAKREADWIAIASSRNLITTSRLDGEYGRTWQITPAGLRMLWERKK